MNLYHWNLEKERGCKLMLRTAFTVKPAILRTRVRTLTGLHQKVGVAQLIMGCRKIVFLYINNDLLKYVVT